MVDGLHHGQIAQDPPGCPSIFLSRHTITLYSPHRSPRVLYDRFKNLVPFVCFFGGQCLSLPFLCSFGRVWRGERSGCVLCPAPAHDLLTENTPAATGVYGLALTTPGSERLSTTLPLLTVNDPQLHTGIDRKGKKSKGTRFRKLL